MRRYTYLFLALFILCLLSIPAKVSDRLRSAAVAALAPPWKILVSLKKGFLYAVAVWPSGGYQLSPQLKEEITHLRLENHQLRQQMELLKAQLSLERLVGEETEILKRLDKRDGDAQRRKAEIERLVELYTPAMVGQVIFREAAAWGSTLWINLGEQSNAALRKTVIAKNSPAVAGKAVVGIVEYVGKRRSRVRLLTDAAIAPSVRVVRGGIQKQVIAEQSRKLLEMLQGVDGAGQSHAFLAVLQELSHLAVSSESSLFLAKGEISGARTPLLRSRSPLLRGVGFNYDFADEEGPGRDLLSGKTNHASDAPAIPLVLKGDLLVTTGMDGVFPAGLHVGFVSCVYSLREGASAYEVDVRPCVENFNDLPFVTILPPLSVDE